jgi:type I restriction enzyme S subunit
MSRIEEQIELELQRAEALRQAILKKAFSGQLVAQDPADEPAGVLLERNRAERETGASGPKAAKKTARARQKS